MPQRCVVECERIAQTPPIEDGLRWITPPSANNSVTVRSSSTVSIRQSDLIFIMSMSRQFAECSLAFFKLPLPQVSLGAESLAPQTSTAYRLQLERPDGSRLTLILPTIDLASAKQICADFLRG